jgi:hypothetical protein
MSRIKSLGWKRKAVVGLALGALAGVPVGVAVSASAQSTSGTSQPPQGLVPIDPASAQGMAAAAKTANDEIRQLWADAPPVPDQSAAGASAEELIFPPSVYAESAKQRDVELCQQLLASNGLSDPLPCLGEVAGSQGKIAPGWYTLDQLKQALAGTGG